MTAENPTPLSREQLEAAARSLKNLSKEISRQADYSKGMITSGVNKKSSNERFSLRQNRKDISNALQLRELLDRATLHLSELYQEGIPKDANTVRTILNDEAVAMKAVDKRNSPNNTYTIYTKTGLQDLSDERLLRLADPDTQEAEKNAILFEHDQKIQVASPWSTKLSETVSPRAEALQSYAEVVSRQHGIQVGWGKQ